MAGVIAEIEANRPRYDREFGAELCHHFGIDPDDVCRVSVYVPPENPDSLIIEFYKYKRERGFWGYEAGPELGPDGKPVIELMAIEHFTRG